MSLRRRLVLGFALGIAALAGVLPAASAASAASSSGQSVLLFGDGPGSAFPVAEVMVPVRVTGQLLVQFNGDPATGCAARGLCGYSGAVSWLPASAGEIDLLEYRHHGHISYASAMLNLVDLTSPTNAAGGSTRAQVSSGLGHGTCADALSTGDSFALATHRGRVSFSLASASPSLVSTHCAGPLQSDLAPALASRTEPTRALLRRGTRIDLTRSATAASHGLADSVRSTVALVLGRPHRIPLASGSPPPRATTDRVLEVDYRAALRGSAVERVAGAADPDLCGPLDACGLGGTLTLVPDELRASGSLSVSAPPRRSLRELLAAVGLRPGTGGRAPAAAGAVVWNRGGTLAARLAQGALTCSDVSGVGGSQILLATHAGQLTVSYQAGGLESPAGLRTRCPGPDGPQGTLASARVPLSALRRRTTRIVLTRGESFREDGYSGVIVPRLILTLTRVRVRTSRVTFFSS